MNEQKNDGDNIRMRERQPVEEMIQRAQSIEDLHAVVDRLAGAAVRAKGNGKTDIKSLQFLAHCLTHIQLVMNELQRTGATLSGTGLHSRSVELGERMIELRNDIDCALRADHMQ